MLQVLMAFRMYVELNKHTSYRPMKKKINKIPVTRHFLNGTPVKSERFTRGNTKTI